jgi:hypothetical protein
MYKVEQWVDKSWVAVKEFPTKLTALKYIGTLIKIKDERMDMYRDIDDETTPYQYQITKCS